LRVGKEGRGVKIGEIKRIKGWDFLLLLPPPEKGGTGSPKKAISRPGGKKKTMPEKGASG